MRKYKQIKRKEVIFDPKEWELIEKWAARFNITTSEYIRQATLTDKVAVAKAPGDWALLINTLKKSARISISSRKKRTSCTASTPTTTKK